MAFRTHTTKNGTVSTLTIDVKKSAFVFSGGRQGEHYLDLLSTDEKRLDAHWHGYIKTTEEYDGSTEREQRERAQRQEERREQFRTGQLRDASRVLPFTTDEG